MNELDKLRRLVGWLTMLNALIHRVDIWRRSEEVYPWSHNELLAQLEREIGAAFIRVISAPRYATKLP
jgi:hypothetical protein